jgi:FkbM family methyltransferase
MFVWNDEQRQEAQALHGFPADRVTVVGAPRFDPFFDLRPKLSRAEFHEPLGLDASRPTIFYVCSSQLVSAAEIGFVRKWLGALRGSSSTALRECNVVVRPHPDIPLLDAADPFDDVRWPALRGAKGLVARPFEDARAVVLRTSDRTQQGFFECIHHSAAVVGLNTTAELEAAIVGRPVYTIVATSDDADGQSSTLHFHYLLEANGGCVRVARDLDAHASQLHAALVSPPDEAAIRQFAARFLRPHGVERPVAPLLADAIERALEAGAGARARAAETGGTAAAAHDDQGAGLAFEPAATPEVVSLSMEKRRYAVSVRVSGEAGDVPDRLDKRTLEWMRRCVQIGDVVYDVDAGLGVYSVIAARYHGAVVVAFEPGFAAHKALCDNVLTNGCDGAVLALPVAVADWDGLGELTYPHGMAGQSRHTLARAPWRARRATGDEGKVRQSVSVLTLDDAARRYELPAPSHIRIGASASPTAVLAGAARLLQLDSLKTILFTLPAGQAESFVAQLAPRWTVAQQTPLARERVQVELSVLT